MDFCWRFFHEYELQPSTSPNQNLVIYYFFVCKKQTQKNGNASFPNISLYDLYICHLVFAGFVCFFSSSTFMLPRTNETAHFEMQITIQILIIILDILWHPINCKHSNANKIAGLIYDCKLFLFRCTYGGPYGINNGADHLSQLG